MTFALQGANLQYHIIGSAKRMPKLKETLNNNENKKERIYQW